MTITAVQTCVEATLDNDMVEIIGDDQLGTGLWETIRRRVRKLRVLRDGKASAVVVVPEGCSAYYAVAGNVKIMGGKGKAYTMRFATEIGSVIEGVKRGFRVFTEDGSVHVFERGN